MSGKFQTGLARIGTYLKSPLGLVHIRTATKRAAGSRTNKNDSAGRRLGPKAYENNFVKPGQIIMRQKGTKIHPGENVGIGRDFTIFALEPGYVRFYLDPFHPLRKYVGVALKKELQLPTPHFSPRIRRFGYVPLMGTQAEAEEASMSRKEELDQPRLQATRQKQAEKAAKQLEQMTSSVAEICPGLSAEQQKTVARRLQFIYQRQKHGSQLDSQTQGTFNFIYDLELSAKRGEIDSQALEAEKKKLIELFKESDSKVSVDFSGAVHPTYTSESRATKAEEIKKTLQQFKGKIPNAEDKQAIHALIAEPGIFSSSERADLVIEFLPRVLPESVPGTVVDPKTKKLPKNAVAQRFFNPKDRSVRTVVRTTDAFLA